MSLAPFGEDKSAAYDRPTLSDCVGYIMALIEREAERTENRKPGGLLDMRLAVVEAASELLQVAESGNPQIMRKALRRFP